MDIKNITKVLFGTLNDIHDLTANINIYGTFIFTSNFQMFFPNINQNVNGTLYIFINHETDPRLIISDLRDKKYLLYTSIDDNHRNLNLTSFESFNDILPLIKNSLTNHYHIGTNTIIDIDFKTLNNTNQLGKTAWDLFLKVTLPPLRSLKLSFPKHSDKAVVMIEPRCHEDLEYVIRNASFHLENQWSLIIYHGTTNKSFIKEKLHGLSNIRYKSLYTDNLTIAEYNQLLLNKKFWKYFKQKSYKTVLILHTDALILKKGINQFIQWNYIGAPWKEGHIQNLRVGNGGFSIHSVKHTLKAIHNHVNQYENNNEDVFYSTYINGIPSAEIASHFASETILNPNSLGLHKIYAYHSNEDVLNTLIKIKYH